MSEENQRKLKGRNTLMLLIVLNLAVYLLETVLIKSKNNQKVKFKNYENIKNQNPFAFLIFVKKLPSVTFFN